MDYKNFFIEVLCIKNLNVSNFIQSLMGLNLIRIQSFISYQFFIKILCFRFTRIKYIIINLYRYTRFGKSIRGRTYMQ